MHGALCSTLENIVVHLRKINPPPFFFSPFSSTPPSPLPIALISLAIFPRRLQKREVKKRGRASPPFSCWSFPCTTLLPPPFFLCLSNGELTRRRRRFAFSPSPPFSQPNPPSPRAYPPPPPFSIGGEEGKYVFFLPLPPLNVRSTLARLDGPGLKTRSSQSLKGLSPEIARRKVSSEHFSHVIPPHHSVRAGTNFDFAESGPRSWNNNEAHITLQKSTRAIDRNGKKQQLHHSVGVFRVYPRSFSPSPLQTEERVRTSFRSLHRTWGVPLFSSPPPVNVILSAGSSRVVLWNSFFHSFSIDRSKCVETV